MKCVSLLFTVALCLAAAHPAAYAAPANGANSEPPQPCPRFAAGSVLIEPKNLYSVHGTLDISLTYSTRIDASGNTLFCFTTPEGDQSPTLHVFPGDTVVIHLKNTLPSSSISAMHGMTMQPAPALELSPDNCGNVLMTATSVNMHYHGTNLPPQCHQDEVIKTLINSGQSFSYFLHFPLDEPPGLYWYHPHIHGMSESAVLGGASGAIIVEGLERVNRDVAGLTARTLIVRDNLVPASVPTDDTVPAWDVSLNYVPVAYPSYVPAILPMKAHQQQLWRVLNASADTILNIAVQFDGVAQKLEVVALDGVPTNSQDGTTGGSSVEEKQILLPPAGRAEFIVAAPASSVKLAQLVTLNVDTGPDGDNDPTRPLATIVTTTAPDGYFPSMPAVSEPLSSPMRFSGLAEAHIMKRRKLYFSEVLSDPSDPNSPTNFYITVDGATPTLFDPNNPPAIVTTQGSVEEWTIENRALENHEFHIHQIHFLVTALNGKPVAGQYLDTVQVPYWSGSGPYPSVTLKMDFRGPDIGDFVYHCHILGHEDSGMMAIIRVQPSVRQPPLRP
jgi:FtsP/CotA-like multicopper oxidase with cupredoxin domain